MELVFFRRRSAQVCVLPQVTGCHYGLLTLHGNRGSQTQAFPSTCLPEILWWEISGIEPGSFSLPSLTPGALSYGFLSFSGSIFTAHLQLAAAQVLVCSDEETLHSIMSSVYRQSANIIQPTCLEKPLLPWFFWLMCLNMASQKPVYMP